MSLHRRLGGVLIVYVGYNESAFGYRKGIDRIMRAALAQGAKGVVWVTLREERDIYRQTNVAIRAAAKRWPQLYVADWNAFSHGKPWFSSDGLHMGAAGAEGLARFLRPFVLRAPRAPDGTASGAFALRACWHNRLMQRRPRAARLCRSRSRRPRCSGTRIRPERRSSEGTRPVICGDRRRDRTGTRGTARHDAPANRLPHQGDDCAHRYRARQPLRSRRRHPGGNEGRAVQGGPRRGSRLQARDLALVGAARLEQRLGNGPRDRRGWWLAGRVLRARQPAGTGDRDDLDDLCERIRARRHEEPLYRTRPGNARARGAAEPDVREDRSTRTHWTKWAVPTRAKLWVNHNKMLGTTPGTYGVKTGWTTKAGGCLIVAVRRGERSVIGVVLASPSIWSDMAALLDVAFRRPGRSA